jgi:hypothetical protein
VLRSEEDLDNLAVLGRQPGMVHANPPDQPPNQKVVYALVEALNHGVQKLL